MNAADLAEALEGRREGNQWRCRCPAHGGKALMVKESDRENPVVHCFGGCDFRDVWAALKDMGLWVDDRKTDPVERRKRSRQREVEKAKREIRRFVDLCEADQVSLRSEYLRYEQARGVLKRYGVDEPCRPAGIPVE